MSRTPKSRRVSRGSARSAFSSKDASKSFSAGGGVSSGTTARTNDRSVRATSNDVDKRLPTSFSRKARGNSGNSRRLRLRRRGNGMRGITRPSGGGTSRNTNRTRASFASSTGTTKSFSTKSTSSKRLKACRAIALRIRRKRSVATPLGALFLRLGSRTASRGPYGVVVPPKGCRLANALYVCDGVCLCTESTGVAGASAAGRLVLHLKGAGSSRNKCSKCHGVIVSKKA